MKTFYIFIEEMDGSYFNSDYSCTASSADEAIDKFIIDCQLGYTGWSFDDDDKWRLYADEDPKFDEHHEQWLRECEEEEILWTRPIEL